MISRQKPRVSRYWLGILGVVALLLAFISSSFFRTRESAHVEEPSRGAAANSSRLLEITQTGVPRVLEPLTASISVDAARSALRIVCLKTPFAGLKCAKASDPPAAFRFEPLDPGEYTVVATSQTGLSKAQHCSLGRSEHKQLSFDFLEKEAGLSLRGRVLDAGGGAIGDARVLVSQPGGDPLAATLTRPDGTFDLLLAQSAATVRVDATAEGYSTASREVDLPTDHLELALTLAGSLFGRVVSGAEPKADAEVQVYVRGAHRLALHTRTQADGTFEVTALEPGSYVVDAAFDSLRASGHTVQVALGERAGPVELELEATASVTGRLTVDGRPCTSGTVSVGDVPDARANTSERGEFNLAALPLGNHGVSLQCSGAKADTKVLALAEPGEHSISWDLRGGAALRVALVNAAGQAVSEMGVQVSDSAPSNAPRQGSMQRECVEQQPGRFLCDGLALGEHTVRAVDAEGLPSKEVLGAVLTQVSEVKEVTLTVATATRIVVNIPQDGAELSGLRVYAEKQNILVGTARRASPTSFVFQRMPAGEYEIYAGGGQRKSSDVAHLSVAGNRAEQQVDLSGLQRGTLRGRIVDEHGSPVVDAWVAPRPLDSMFPGDASDPAPVLTNVDGWFEVARLASGAYLAEVKSALGTLSIEELITDKPSTFVLSAAARGANHD